MEMGVEHVLVRCVSTAGVALVWVSVRVLATGPSWFSSDELDSARGERRGALCIDVGVTWPEPG